MRIQLQTTPKQYLDLLMLAAQAPHAVKSRISLRAKPVSVHFVSNPHTVRGPRPLPIYTA